MIEEKHYQTLVDAANQAEIYGHSVEQLLKSEVDARELAESILNDERRKARVTPRYIPILQGFLGLGLNKDAVQAAAANTYYNSLK